MPLPWPLPDRTDLRDQLVAAYSTGRGYHDLRHLTEVLDRIVELGEGDNLEVVLAAWFHDAVYDGAASNEAGDNDGAGNEERSAQLAESSLADSEVDVAEVARLVRLTTTHRPAPGDHNGEVLCDADLAILAAPPQRYAEYVAGVRAEYAAVPEEDFRLGRLAILEALEEKSALFATEHARRHWEPAARANLAAEIARLRG
jgi:predicted metal-dependent HD superfamily phosphohydrolase